MHMAGQPSVVSLSWLLLLAPGCGSLETIYDLPEEPPAHPTRESMEITDRHGGTHHRTEVVEGVWYQTFGTELLVLEAADGSESRRLAPLSFGAAGALVDMEIDGDRMFLVADGDAVVELDLTDARTPAVREIRRSEALGVRPRAVALIDGRAWISGDGGVVRWDEPGNVMLSGESVRAPVVRAGSDLVVPVGRQVRRILDGSYLGAATELVPLDPATGFDGGMLFVLQGSEGASVGTMGPDIRQVDDFVMRGVVRRIRLVQGRVWAVTDTEIGTAELLPDGRLGPVEWIKVKGARDLDAADENYLAVGGTFGRALYRHRQDSSGDADTFLAVTREPGSLLAAVDDGRRVLAGSNDGAWLYTIGDSIEIVDRQIKMDTPRSDFAAGKWGDVRVVEDGGAVIIHLDERDQRWRPSNAGRIRTLAVMGDRIWIGHDEGLALIRINGREMAEEQAYFDRPPPPRIEFVRDVRVASGVSHILPVRVGDEVVWVSPNGGIGVAKASRIPDPDWTAR